MNTTKKTISMLPGFNMATTNMIAQHLGADVPSIRRIGARLWDQMTTLGAIHATKEDFINHGYEVEKIGSGYHCRRDSFDIIIPISIAYAILYTAECVDLFKSTLANPKTRTPRKLRYSVSPAEDQKDTAVSEAQQLTAKPAQNGLQVFSNETFGSIRTIMRDGEPWFVGKDVAAALGYVKPENAIATHVFEEDKGVTKLMTPGGKQNITVINESGFYALVLSSKLPSAREFQRWVTSEILPSLRKNGAYIMGQETMTEVELIAKALIACKRIVDKQEAKIAQLQCENTVLMGEVESWDYPSMINALMRSYATLCCSGRFEAAWMELYRRIRYKHHIDVKRRKNETGKGYFKCIKAEEMPIVAQVAAAMCESAGLDVAIIINSVNAEKVS